MEFLTFSDIKNKLIGFFRSNIGENINLSDSEVGGQIVNLGADACSDIHSSVVDAYNANTLLAEGQDLDIQASRMATARLKATYAKIYNFKIVCSGTCEITTDAKFQNSNSVQFSPVENSTYETGTHRISVQAVNAGSISISENDVNTIVSSVTNLDSVTNDSSSIFQNGREIETDEELRERLQSYSSSITYTESAIKKAIEELSYVVRATIKEDDVNGTIEAIVEQSDLTDTAKTEVCEKIAYSKAGGILAISNATGANKIEREIGSTTIQYTLPTLKEIYVRLTLSPSLTTEQQTSLADYLYSWSLGFLAGETLIIYGTDSLLTACVNWSGVDFSSVQIEVSENGTDWNSSNMTATDYEIIRIPSENVSFI